MSNFFKQYRSSKKNYKVRVDEFIVKGYDISTIQKLIHREYGIRLKKSSINKIFLKRVDQEKIHKISESDNKTSNLDFINEIGNHQNLKKLFFDVNYNFH